MVLITQTHYQLELKLVEQVVLVIYFQAVQVLLELLMPQAQVAAAEAIALLAVTHQVQQVALAETVAVAVAVHLFQVHQVLVATAYFIFTTKEQ